MHRAIFYSLVVLFLAVPSVLLAAVFIESDEENIEALLSEIEGDRLSAVLDKGAFDDGGLEVSYGSRQEQFRSADRTTAQQLLDQLTGIDSAESVDLTQQRITIRDDRATVVLNVEVDDQDYVALTLNLKHTDDEWLVERIRVMS